jgi:hypothetical protein
MITLSDKRDFLQNLGKEIFEKITSIDSAIRKDDKPRTGFQSLLRVLDTTNRITFPVYEPSERAKTFVEEKSSRTEENGHATSQDSEDPDNLKFRGCVSYEFYDENCIVHSSVSGLLGTEDVAAAIILLSEAIDKTVDEIMYNISERGGELPEELSQKGHYLCDLLDEYR